MPGNLGARIEQLRAMGFGSDLSQIGPEYLRDLEEANDDMNITPENWSEFMRSVFGPANCIADIRDFQAAESSRPQKREP